MSLKLILALMLFVVVGVVGIRVAAHAQSTGAGTGLYGNTGSGTGTSGSGTTGTTGSGTTGSGTTGSGTTGTTGASGSGSFGTSGTTGTNGGTSSGTPGVPNTGAGGASTENALLLGGSALILALGTVYLIKQARA